MTWGAVFVVFYVSHLTGDYIFQTDFQAMNKRGGLGRNPTARKALFSHTLVYSTCYVPAFIWLQTQLGWNTVLIAAAITLPHLIQDDQRLLWAYERKVKKLDPIANHTIAALVDQAFHMVALFGAALLVSAIK